MDFPPLEDAKKEATKLLGSGATIPAEKVDLGKIAKDLTAGYAEFTDAAEILNDKISKLLSVLDKWTDALKTTEPLFIKGDFGLDPKADSQKIAKAQKIFVPVFNIQSAYKESTAEFKKVQTQYRDVMKTKLP